MFGTGRVWHGQFAEAKVKNMVQFIPLTFLATGNNNLEEVLIKNEVVIETDNNIKNNNLVLATTTTKEVVKIEPIKKIKTVPNELVKEINLAVPFTSQAPERNWEQPWQDACEEAAVLMLDAYYKNYTLSPYFAKDEILKMVEWESSKSWGNSINIEKVAELLNWQFGGLVKKTQLVENFTVEQVKKSIASGNPVLLVVSGKDLPNPYFSNGGPDYHALIVRGYTEDSFITNDPGTWRGENFLYKYEDLMAAAHDWNDGNVKSGKAVALFTN